MVAMINTRSSTIEPIIRKSIRKNFMEAILWGGYVIKVRKDKDSKISSL
jgi:hypothetical protein